MANLYAKTRLATLPNTTKMATAWTTAITGMTTPALALSAPQVSSMRTDTVPTAAAIPTTMKMDASSAHWDITTMMALASQLSSAQLEYGSMTMIMNRTTATAMESGCKQTLMTS